MTRYTFGLCLMTALCSLPAWADNPGTGPYDAPAADKTKAENKCRPCYELPSGCPKPKVKAACEAFDKANPNYFNNIDQQCGLPSGTAAGFANIESSCNQYVTNRFGYTGMFQFNTKSCSKGSLTDLAVQASCMCDYTANTRRSYQKNNPGESPSAGMYYLVHQQGTCGLRLATAGNQRAVDVIAACVEGTRSSPMSYAIKAISNNLPAGLGLNANTVTAQQFADGWMKKFGDSTKKTSNNDVCAADGSTPETATPPTTTGTGAGAGGGDMASIGAFSSALNASGNPLSAQLIQYIMTTPMSQVMPGMLTYNPQYDEDDSSDTTTQETVNVTTNTDGTVKVTVVDNGNNTKTYTVNHGQQLWKCDGVYQVAGAAQESTMTARGCSKIAESAAVTSSSTSTDTQDEDVGGIQQ